jgi:predicted N-acyltransferase
LPKPTYSAHWIAHSGLRRAIGNFLEDERLGIHAEMASLAQQSPFRKDSETD